MVEITDSLKCLYTATVDDDGAGGYTVTVPEAEVGHGTLSEGETYRVVLLDHDGGASADAAATAETTASERDRASAAAPNGPPVSEGEVREVTIETLGDQGDGIAKIERGYVVIVPDADLGDEVTVEITAVRENVSFAEIVE
ncbi:TRAM domain-containing protein [Haloparvum sedimenti]|uniref:TRAM domain-containing protein n=1 Tax=Haloparvum sedimenti TaxID=1678448 RepID=UPI00071E7A76|nr:TRAM domain-containing protein [Haloparvum sedimenti]